MGIEPTPSRCESGDFVPEWAKSAVWYQIFPERFRNGDPGNDPVLEDLRGAWPHDLSEPWQIHRWTSDWYELAPYERANGRNFWFNVQRRRYGGDLEGLLSKLDYLEDLGVNALYLNPVFKAPSSHKYDGETYHHIDPTFGPDPRGDLELIAAETPDDPSTWTWTSADRLALQLIRELHARGMKIIFDGVFNHMGVSSWAFRDILEKQRKSRFGDWFDIESWDDACKGTRFKYRGWFGVPELPELRRDESGIADGPKQYIFAATRRWMDPDGDGDPADGIDGWRLDVAFCVPHPFWKSWRVLVRSINPDAYLCAEVVAPPDSLKPYLLGDEFDAVMNYNFAFACDEYFFAEKERISTHAFDRELRVLRSTFPAGVSYVMQNLFGSHDTARLGSHLVNRDRLRYRHWRQYHRRSRAENGEYDTRKPTAAERAAQKLFVIFQMTYPGAPMIYYGDEAGMWGANDPDCRKPMVWPDLDYDMERVHPDGTPRAQPDAVEFDRDLFDHYRRLIRLRRAMPALARGEFETIRTDDADGIYIYLRRLGEQKAAVVLNNSRSNRRVRLDALFDLPVRDLLDPGFSAGGGGSALILDVGPQWARILAP